MPGSCVQSVAEPVGAFNADDHRDVPVDPGSAADVARWTMNLGVDVPERVAFSAMRVGRLITQPRTRLR